MFRSFLRPFLRFAFEGQAWQYRVLPFGFSLSPRVITKVVESALAPLREEKLCDHRDLVLRHLSQLGLRVNWEKSKLSPVERIYFLGVELDSVCMTARLTDERAQSVLNCLSSFRGRTVVPLKQFQGLLGHMASTATVTPLGLLHMRPLQHWFQSRVPRWVWRHGTQYVVPRHGTMTLGTKVSKFALGRWEGCNLSHGICLSSSVCHKVVMGFRLWRFP